jgi:excisionase family DNA binding protein
MIAQKEKSATKVIKRSGFGKRLYTIKEMACEIGATEWYWRSQIWEGNIPYIQVGRKMFIESRDIEKFIETHRTSN